MADLPNVPKGIRNNNPGNMRNIVGRYDNALVIDGFASFASLQDGVSSWFHLIHYYYVTLNLKTLPEIIRRYAPPVENETNTYIRFTGIRMGLNPLKWVTQDLHLTEAWPAIDLARAIFAMENGIPPANWPTHPEWVSPHVMVNAIADTRLWDMI